MQWTSLSWIRDLYAFSSQRWVDEGRTRHYALVPRFGDQVEAWFRLSFGAQQAHGIKAVELRAWPPGTRHAEPVDLEALIELAPLVSDLHALAPVFSGVDRDDDGDELRAVLAAEIASDEVGELVYERDGQVVASFELAPVEKVSMHRGLAQPDGAACITWAASLPDVRGSGAGLVLTEAALAWAREQGYARIVTDWRETNLLASRFWPSRGFRRSFFCGSTARSLSSAGPDPACVRLAVCSRCHKSVRPGAFVSARSLSAVAALTRCAFSGRWRWAMCRGKRHRTAGSSLRIRPEPARTSRSSGSTRRALRHPTS